MSLASLWAAHFGDLIPVAHLLREALAASRWLRIHSLPQSRRYPKTEADYDELLRRHNEAASLLLGVEAPCTVVVARYATESETIDWEDQGRLLGLELRPTTLWGRPHDVDEGVFLEFGIATVTWQAGLFDLVRAVADDRERGLLFISPTTVEVYAPYDGGADLFLTDVRRRNELRSRWQQWLSSRPDGL